MVAPSAQASVTSTKSWWRTLSLEKVINIVIIEIVERSLYYRNVKSSPEFEVIASHVPRNTQSNIQQYGYQLERPRVGNVKWCKMQIIYGLFKTIGIDVDILPLQIY